MPPSPIEERFALALHTTARAWRQGVDRRLKHLGVGQAGWLAIATIAKAHDPLSQIELAQALGVEGPSLVSLIDRLAKAGLVLRRPSGMDRRVKHVVLTEAGREAYASVRSEASRYRHELLNGFDRNRLLEVTQLLESLQTKIKGGL